MNKGLSLHIGLNFVDPDHYDGWDGELAACEFDADDMQALAKSQGFKTTKLLRKKATAKAVKKEILAAAETLESGDTFFLTYSGHGGQVPDTNGDEGLGGHDDRMDETWCLYDRQVVDDELAVLYAQFKPGVRVVVLSDSCHSGTVTRAVRRLPVHRVRLLPPAKSKAVYLKNLGIYEAIQAGVSPSEQLSIAATVLLISGCQDEQYSLDGDKNGLFTGTLKEIWNDGGFEGDYRHLHHSIVRKMPPSQIPNYFVYGAPNPAFESEKPFSIGAEPSRKRSGGRSRSLAKKKGSSASPVEIVIEILNHYGFPKGAQPDSKLTPWFKRVAKEDEEMSVPGAGRLGLIAASINERLGVGMTPSKMVGGHYETPQDIADLA